MWLVIVVGLGWLLLPFIMRVFWLVMAVGLILLILSFIYKAALWVLIPFCIYWVGQRLIDRHYIKTGKGKYWASHKIKGK
ncbi:hypothetical protein [Liquorilactobacillus uvarum]|uniref:hypothetical protein n=1 Tax=Liquorilactobacillus uvarum TaxID=303240 RepID=UPI0028891090|nr:hypothetical protein [Liquorilactobacillus uvarum]